MATSLERAAGAVPVKQWCQVPEHHNNTWGKFNDAGIFWLITVNTAMKLRWIKNLPGVTLIINRKDQGSALWLPLVMKYCFVYYTITCGTYWWIYYFLRNVITEFTIAWKQILFSIVCVWLQIFSCSVKPTLKAYLEAVCIVGFICVCPLVICIPLLIDTEHSPINIQRIVMRLWLSLILTLGWTDNKLIGHSYFMFGSHLQEENSMFCSTRRKDISGIEPYGALTLLVCWTNSHTCEMLMVNVLHSYSAFKQSRTKCFTIRLLFTQRDKLRCVEMVKV